MIAAVGLFLFFLSGAAGLSYEVAWTRSMIFVLGNTNLAVGLVLGLFLLGFFLGSAVASRWGRDRAGLLRRYALVEAGIGAAGLVVPLLVAVAKDLYPSAAGWLSPGVVRTAFSILIILPPTFLMGATFPLMNGILITNRERAARLAGLVYGLQTLGAAAGAGTCGFFLIRTFGLAHTSWITAAANGTAAAGALCLVPFAARSAGGGAPGSRRESSPDVRNETPGGTSRDAGPAGVLFAVLFCTGFASLVLEVLWTRILVFFIDGLTYSFTAMLVVYLLALAAGSIVLALFGSVRKTGYATAGLILAAGGIAAIACLLWIPRLYDIIQALKGDPSRYAFGAFLLSSCAGSGLILFVPSFLIGMVTPLAIGILVRERGGACREAGLAYAFSCLGCCAGALAASTFVVPLVGLKTGVVMAGLLVITGGILLFNVARIFWVLKAAVSLLPLTLAFVLALEAIVSPPLVCSSHVFKRPGRRGRTYLEGYSEGNVCTASVILDSRRREFRLYTDGFSAASTGRDYRYMRMMGHLPALACPRPERSLVICYGTGTTAGSLSLHPDVGETDIVEISEAVMRLAHLFRAVNRGVGLDAPGADGGKDGGGTGEKAAVRLHTEIDGRDFLNLSRSPFDLITLEPLMPYTPAAVHFYTAEFYELCLEKMTPRGVLCQWIPLNALPLGDLRLLLGTFASVMPGSGFFLFENSLLLLGFRKRDWSIGARRAAAFFEDQDMARDLRVAGCPDPAAIFGSFICDGKRMRALTAKEGLMRDDLTKIEYVSIAPGVAAYKRMSRAFGFLAAALQPMGNHVDYSGLASDSERDLKEALASYVLSSRYLLKGLQAAAAASYNRCYPDSGLPASDSGRFFEKAFNLNPRDRRAARRFALGLVEKAESFMSRGDFAAARDAVDRAALLAPDLFELETARALLFMANGDLDGLKGALDRMGMMRPHSNMELAIRARMARIRGGPDAETLAAALSKSLEKWGGLSAFEKDLVDRAAASALSRKKRGTLDIKRLCSLLERGHDGISPDGRMAWSEAAAAGEDLLKKARRILLDKLAAGGREARRAAAALAFFRNDKDVLAALRGAYLSSAVSDRPALLEALYHAGDSAAYIEVLSSTSASTALFVKAEEIAAAAKNRKAISPLIDLLEHRSERVRLGALVALIEITGLKFGFDPYGDAASRREAVERWRKWNRIRENGGRGK